MEKWKRNMFMMCAVQFLAMASISCVTPFLPLYLQQLGLAEPEAVRLWSGYIFGANLLTAFIFSFVWGKLGDRYGRKPMLVRAGIGTALTITLMGFVTDHIQLLLLRLLNGAVSGFAPAASALVAVNAPKERSGYALGMFHSSSISGTICGPLIGGVFADLFGFRAVFSFLGISMFGVALLVIFTVQENIGRMERKSITTYSEDFKVIVSRKPLPALFVSAFMIRAATVGTLPLVPLYVQQLVPEHANLALLAGVSTAAAGIASMMAAPQLGKLGDRFGAQYVLVFASIGAAVFFVPQAFAQNLWQLIALRFCSGLFLGGITPSIHVLIRRHAPSGMESRTYSYANSALILGGMAGAAGMGAAASVWGLAQVFICSAVILMIHVWWMRQTILSKRRG
jgi:DHA1 family multidrug resistance protein-like MFS transporter